MSSTDGCFAVCGPLAPRSWTRCLLGPFKSGKVCFFQILIRIWHLLCVAFSDWLLPLRDTPSFSGAHVLLIFTCHIYWQTLPGSMLAQPPCSQTPPLRSLLQPQAGPFLTLQGTGDGAGLSLPSDTPELLSQLAQSPREQRPCSVAVPLLGPIRVRMWLLPETLGHLAAPTIIQTAPTPPPVEEERNRVPRKQRDLWGCRAEGVAQLQTPDPFTICPGSGMGFGGSWQS